MKAYKIELLIIDHDEIGSDEMADIIENMRYPNHCMSPDVMDIQEVDLGEWDDSLPINQTALKEQEYKRLFNIK